jgi:predicted SAM-dependent methyltransferase
MLGAAGKEVEGWLSTDLDILDAVRAMNWSFLFRKNSIEAILAEHVWEHLDIDDARRAARNCYRYLKTGGHLRLAVPDGYHPDQAYIEYVKPGGSGIGSDTHKHLYTYRDLTTLLNGVGFEVDLLEYWDECGQFHYKSWEKKDGLVLRSMNYDKRNRIVPLSYTSLIVDARK